MSVPVPASKATTGTVATIEAPAACGEHRRSLARRIDRIAQRIAPYMLSLVIGLLLAAGVIFRG